jgi:PAS domain S-box-containing protein
MRSGALRIAIIYIIVALIWITLSDRVLYIFHSTLAPQLYLAIGSGKGYFFVMANAIFLYKLISNDKKKLIESTKESIRFDSEIKKLGNILTKVNNIIIITNENNFITWVNKAFEDFTGYQFDEVAGYAPATFFAGGETDTELLATIIRKKKALEAFSAEVNCYKKCGTKFWVSGEYTPLFDDNNNFTGYIAVYNDITGLKEKEKDTVRQNDKLKEVAWLSSHEIRRPLANIIGLADLLKASSDLEEKTEIVERVSLSAEELDEIVHVISSKIHEEINVEAVQAQHTI